MIEPLFAPSWRWVCRPDRCENDTRLGNSETVVRERDVCYASPMIKQSFFAITVALFFTPALPLRAQEHPEHPKKAESKEHPAKGSKEHPQSVSTADISAEIRKDIDTKSKKASDGKFHTNYEGKDLALELVKVHDDRLSDLGNGKYFACVDMKATDDTTYDIDFFMSGKPGNMKVTDTSVHKVNGKPLYNWKEENGVWKKVARS
jgi:hypothetical protein